YLGVHCKIDCFNSIGCSSAAGGTKKLERHDFYIPVDAGHSNAVVAYTANRPGTVRAMVIIVERVTSSRYRIETVCSWPTAADCTRVTPYVCSKVGMVVVNSSIH